MPNAKSEFKIAGFETVTTENRPLSTNSDRVKALTNKSNGVGRLIAYPEDNILQKSRKNKQYMANSKAPMERLADLDRRPKNSIQRSQSNVFDTSVPTIR